MKISIAARNRPFSHQPGASALLPRTCWVVQAFPTKVCLPHQEISINVHGPVREFTLQQDLEAGTILVWGVAMEGRFRLRLQAVEGAIELWVEKAPPSGIIISGKTIHKNGHLSWDVSGPFCDSTPLERLSLGTHRAQDWENVWRRLDFTEIFPVLFHLSQWTPKPSQQEPTAMGQLLNLGFEPFLRAAFYGILSPRLIDDQFQGLVADETVDPKASPTSLIVDAGARIRSLFVQQQRMEIRLLPSLQFDHGRMMGVQLDQIGSIDFEWSKKTLQRAILRATCDARVYLKLPPSIRSFRLRSQIQEKGSRKSLDDPLVLKAGTNYFLDRFQK